MELGELGEPVQEQEQVSVFWCKLLLFQCSRTCQGPGSMLPMVFFGLRSMGDPGLFRGVF